MYDYTKSPKLKLYLQWGIIIISRKISITSQHKRGHLELKMEILVEGQRGSWRRRGK